MPVFGSGLGHAARIHALVNSIRQNVGEYLFSSFDEAYDFLEQQGEKVVRSPSVTLMWNEIGGFSARDSFVRFPLEILKFSRQVAFESRLISNFDPDLVVSDSRLSAIIAAKTKRRSVVTVLNQFKILFPPRFRGNIGSRLFERIEGDVLGLLWDLSDDVVMPDLPPPYTISEANITGCDVANRIRYVGFMSPKTTVPKRQLEAAKSVLSLEGRPLVFIQISGPAATKQRFERIALRATPYLSKTYDVVISLGVPNGSIEPRKLSNNSWIYEWCPIKDELFQLADVVVTRAGHATVSQCIDNRIPAVYVPIFNHSEQIWNSQKCQELGIGIQLKSEHLHVENLMEHINRCLSDPDFKSNLERINAISRKYNGILETARIIKSYL